MIISIDTEKRQTQHKKGKLQANIADEHRCKTPQQNFSTQNSATHQKAQKINLGLFQGCKDPSIYTNQSM